METFSALLALCEVNAPVTGGFPSQRPVMRSFDVFFDLWLNGWTNNRDAEQTVEQTIEMPVTRDAIALIMTSL